MSTNKIIQALGSAAGSAGGAALNVEDVFSTYLYTGTGSDITITNGIDFAGEGGLVWSKRRDNSQNHYLIDTERGGNKILNSDGNGGNVSVQTITFNSDGYTHELLTSSGQEIVNWAFRKAPKFFDVVTYTGDGVSGREIAHNLGTTVGTIILKRTDASQNWVVFHRSLNYNSGNPYWLLLNLTNAESTSGGILSGWDDNSFTVTSSSFSNASGGTYVAYLFAHNDGDGEFGPDADQDIIKCGSYTGDGTTNGTNEVTLGFEPQWILTKRSDSADNWHICDVMRGQTTDGITQRLRANTSAAESGNYGAVPTATGFKLYSDNSSGGTYIYIAIRRGPMGIPESATDVFTPVLATSSGTFTAEAGFPVDLNWYARRSVADGGFTWDRLRGANYLKTNSTGAETAYSAASFDSNTAFYLDGLTGDYSDYITYNWRRAPNFFDVVAYGPFSSTSTAKTISHNLGVAPEMMWVKSRGDSGAGWVVYHKGVAADPETDLLQLSSTSAVLDINTIWNDTAPTATSFTVGTSTWVQSNVHSHIAYLFASLDGISKVGSYTGDGTTGRIIDCGFSNGARFVLIKRTDTTDGWYVWDSERGIVAGNDPYLLLNSTAAEDIYTDAIEPHSSGFIINQEVYISRNFSGGNYIFYAIA